MAGRLEKGAQGSLRGAALALVAALSTAVLFFPAGAAGAEGCPNAQPRSEDSSLSLPDCRAYELVSPAEKNGGAVGGPGESFGGGVLAAAASGEAATFSSKASFGEAARGAPPASQYLSRRTEAGWLTANITPPTLSGAYGDEPNGVPFQLFSLELERGLLLNGARCAEGEECPRSYSLQDEESGALITSTQAPDLSFAGASPDLNHVILATCAALTPEATEVPNGEGGCVAADPNLYEWAEGELALINVLPGETQGTPGARLAAQGGAVSAEGSRVYFTDAGNLYLREGTHTAQVDEEAGGGGSFQSASADGSFAFFTKEGHLYRYEARFEDLSTIDLTPGGEVEGVLAASADGSRVYYQTATGLFLWSQGKETEIAAGAEAAQPSDYPPATATARTTPDGSHLAFLSRESEALGGYDNHDRATGEPDSEVYLYDATANGGAGQLTCASCNPTGERPQGPSSIPGAIANGTGEAATDSYRPRALSTDGTRLFFDSADTLLPRDTSATPDVYEWEAQGKGSCQTVGGCLFLISSGNSARASTLIDASSDGRDAFFLTVDSLLGTDPGSFDLYDARELGGFPEPKGATPCEGDACQAVPSPPEDPSPGTLVPGPPNPAVHFHTPRCPKGKVRRHGRCVRPRHRHRRRRIG